MKFAVVSHILPPSSSGQAMVLQRLLYGLDPECYCLISQRDYSKNTSQKYTSKLPGGYHKILTEFQLRDLIRYSRGLISADSSAIRFIDTIISFLWLPFRAMQIARILHKERCQLVVACTADLINPPAAYLASLLLKISYYPYIFDYYSYQWTDTYSRFFAKLFEPIILKGAKSVIVPNESLQLELKKRYNIQAEVVHNPYEGPKLHRDLPWPFNTKEISIVYTGAVYYVHYDAFHNLIEAIRLLSPENIRLHVYTNDSHEMLKSKGICGPVVFHDHLELSQALAIQKKADVLFLPMAFASNNPEIIKTSSPGKMGEYLISGRPVLVHAPPDSFVSKYFREHECGLVVDDQNAESLARALRQIIDGDDLRKRMVKKAIQCADEDFELESIRKRFLMLIGALSEANRPKIMAGEVQ